MTTAGDPNGPDYKDHFPGELPTDRARREALAGYARQQKFWSWVATVAFVIMVLALLAMALDL